jgi:hypothetical protein
MEKYPPRQLVSRLPYFVILVEDVSQVLMCYSPRVSL